MDSCGQRYTEVEQKDHSSIDFYKSVNVRQKGVNLEDMEIVTARD